MTRKHIGASTATAQPTGPARIRFPFWQEGDRTTLIIEQTYHQDWATLTAPIVSSPIDISQINANSYQLPNNVTNCILLDDTPPEAIGNGVCQFTRTWGTVPLPRSVPQMAGVEYPGTEALRVTVSIRRTRDVFGNYSLFTGSWNNPTSGTRVYAIFDIYKFGSNISTRTWDASNFTGTVGFPNTFGNIVPDFDVNNIPLVSTNNFQPASTRVLAGWDGFNTAEKQSKAEFVSARLEITYHLGVLNANKNLQQKLQIVNSTNAVVTKLTQTTVPSSQDWETLKFNQESFVAENSQLRRYAGEIYEVSTLYAPAR